jgi:hypothetical protein
MVVGFRRDAFLANLGFQFRKALCCQECSKFVWWYRLANQIALHLVAVVRPKESFLLDRLHSLSDDSEIECTTECYGRVGNRPELTNSLHEEWTRQTKRLSQQAN